MKKLFLIALPAIAMSLEAAESTRPLQTGHVEISINDLPDGSSKDLGAAVREYSKNLDANSQRSVQATPSHRGTKAAEELVVYPKEHVYDVDEVLEPPRLNEKLILKDYSSLMIKPVELNVTNECHLLGASANGVYNRKTKEYSGFARLFKCPTGEVYTRDMTFYGMRKITIKEQNNVDIQGIGAKMYGYKDKNGSSYTTLTWVSNNVDHLVQKSGVDGPTRDWLIRYAEELVSKEAK